MNAIENGLYTLKNNLKMGDIRNETEEDSIKTT